MCTSSLGEQAGLGLFTRTGYPRAGCPISRFAEKKGQVDGCDVILCRGKEVPIERGPTAIDSLAAYSNSLPSHNNSTIKCINREVWIVSVRPIKKGEEIFTSYGRSYNSTTGGSVNLRTVRFGKFKGRGEMNN